MNNKNVGIILVILFGIVFLRSNVDFYTGPPIADFKLIKAVYDTDSGYLAIQFDNNGSLTAYYITVVFDCAGRDFIEECDSDEYIVSLTYLEKIPRCTEEIAKAYVEELYHIRVTVSWYYYDENDQLMTKWRDYKNIKFQVTT